MGSEAEISEGDMAAAVISAYLMLRSAEVDGFEEVEQDSSDWRFSSRWWNSKMPTFRSRPGF